MGHDTDLITAPGFKLGHWTHPEGITGCTVLLADDLVPAAVDIRGGSPGTRETDLLGPGKAIQRVDAVLLTGGSAFGLAAAEGVMQWLHEQGRGYPTAVTKVPIVSGAVIFDLQSDPPVWPGSDEGYAAVSGADDHWTGGRLGGGTGASVSKTLGRGKAVPSGTGIAQASTAAGLVTAVFVNNAVGDVFDPERSEYLTCPGNGSRSSEAILLDGSGSVGPGSNTIIGAIGYSRPLGHDALTRLTIAGHAGIARVIRPAHTAADGDTVFALSTGKGLCTPSDLLQLSVATQQTVARALVNAVSQERNA